MTVGFWSPLPPARSGVAEYSAGLLPAMQRLGPVRVNDESADAPLYHVGNNGLHAGIYQRALEKPGVIVLHDAVLHHFLLGQCSEAEYIDEFVYNYGEWRRGLARELWRQRARSGVDARYFAFPMLRRLVERARSVIVHNPAAAALVRAHAPEVPVVEIAHYFPTPPSVSPEAVARLRGELGVMPEGILFGVFGHLRESKRVLPVLRAFRRVRAMVPGAVLLLAGQPASRDLASALDAWRHEPGVVQVGYLAEDAFWRHAMAVDVCVNLRYPAAGETSGIAIRLMGLGKPVVLTGGGEVSRFPEDSFLRIDPGLGEEEMLAACLLWVARHRSSAAEVGLRAGAYIAAHHGVEPAAAAYWRVLRNGSAHVDQGPTPLH